MIISKTDDEQYVTGLSTFDRSMGWTDALRQEVCDIAFDITCAGVKPLEFRIETKCRWMSFSEA